MVEKIITCITCPIGCDITVRGTSGEISYLNGHQCTRGDMYARNEFTHPARILTTTVKINGSYCPLISVRSDSPIPQELLMQCMVEIKGKVVCAPICRYDIIIPNILGTGANIVATGEEK